MTEEYIKAHTTHSGSLITFTGHLRCWTCIRHNTPCSVIAASYEKLFAYALSLRNQPLEVMRGKNRPGSSRCKAHSCGSSNHYCLFPMDVHLLGKAFYPKVYRKGHYSFPDLDDQDLVRLWNNFRLTLPSHRGLDPPLYVFHAMTISSNSKGKEKAASPTPSISPSRLGKKRPAFLICDDDEFKEDDLEDELEDDYPVLKKPRSQAIDPHPSSSNISVSQPPMQALGFSIQAASTSIASTSALIDNFF